MSEEASASPLHGKLCQKSDGFETEIIFRTGTVSSQSFSFVSADICGRCAHV